MTQIKKPDMRQEFSGAASKNPLQEVGKFMMFGGLGLVGLMALGRIAMVSPPLALLTIAGVGAWLYFGNRRKGAEVQENTAANDAPAAPPAEPKAEAEFISHSKKKTAKVISFK